MNSPRAPRGAEDRARGGGAERARHPGSPPSSIRDVALAAGVSVATVSRALRGLDRVSEDTRERVLRAAEALDYVASPTAASLATGRTSVVGIVLPFLDRWFFATIVSEIEDVLRRSGFQVLLLNIGDRSGEDSMVLDQRLLAKRIDGIIVLGVDLEAAEASVLRRLALPVVTISASLPGCDRVGIDDVAAAESATQHLLALGHRRIGYVGGDSSNDVRRATAVDRARGVHHALAAAGLALEPELDAVADWTVTGGWRAAEGLLARRLPPTAILAASDEMAIGVLCAARALGWSVPRHLSVVGIDDHEMAVTHGLTTVAQPVRSQGRIAAEMLLAHLASGTRAAPARDVVLSTAMVLRSSTAAPRTEPRPRRRAGAAAAVGRSPRADAPTTPVPGPTPPESQSQSQSQSGQTRTPRGGQRAGSARRP
ncbi:DNA-binding LacI/PurR family transcriptional regulator [Kineococcus xinjiangensis]|uniref:DNA-binding LacI/PurR family transcriptional regulator n=1 Tax=Kineococcus xinjiangensis TaxID=512762 RepID=A0A2S6IKH2_9ACTN|nr:LacI family DNA-binding transcriptional regulator [Kineococcus xinjiangensis]PPK94676.1 DNA-binding LacI/PurR family transcriptional regulator [Kineococcus xinjiangensis]